MSDKMENGLSDLEMVAIGKMGRDVKVHRNNVSSGKAQEVDFIVRVKGMLNVAEDGETTKTTKPDGKAVLALVYSLLTENGRKQLQTKMREAIEESAYNGDPMGSFKEIEEEHAIRAAATLEGACVKKTSARQGAVTGSIEFARMNPNAVSKSTIAKMSHPIRKIDLS